MSQTFSDVIINLPAVSDALFTIDDYRQTINKDLQANVHYLARCQPAYVVGNRPRDPPNERVLLAIMRYPRRYSLWGQFGGGLLDSDLEGGKIGLIVFEHQLVNKLGYRWDSRWHRGWMWVGRRSGVGVGVGVYESFVGKRVCVC